MTDDRLRTDANSHEHGPDRQYSLSVEQTADLYAQAGHPRTIRAIQKYCALSKLDCHKVETETGEKYLVAPYSVARHLSYINEVQTVANNREQTRTNASIRLAGTNDASTYETVSTSTEQPRMDAPIRAGDKRYIARLESENEFLRGQMQVKDSQIKEVTERARETNVLINGLQKILTPLLNAPGFGAKGDNSINRSGHTV